MSWQSAKTEAEKIFSELKTKHDLGFIGMVCDALDRRISEEKILTRLPDGKKIVSWRERKKFTQREAVRFFKENGIEISQTHLAKIETGHRVCQKEIMDFVAI